MVSLYPPASCSAITPVFCLSHLISFCHFCNKLFLSHHSAPHSCAFIGALHSTCHVSPCRFHPSLCRSLNPLSFALLGLHPSRFSSCSPEAVSMCCPISTYCSPFPLILPDSFPLCYGFHPSPPYYLGKVHDHPSLPQAFPSPSYTFPA